MESAGEPNSKKRILVIDDHSDWRHLVSSTLRLKFKHADIEEVNSSAAGIEKLRKGAYSLVICDYQMPGGSGLEVFAFLQSESHTNIPFILFTASSDVTALKEKMIVISKSAIEELLDVIDSLLRNSREGSCRRK